MSSWDAFSNHSILVPDVSFMWFLISYDWFAKRLWNWNQNVWNLIRNLIGNLIQMFWRQYRESAELAGKFQKFTFHLIKRVIATQMRTCCFNWFCFNWQALWISHFESFPHIQTVVQSCHIGLLVQIRQILMLSWPIRLQIFW